MGILYPSPELEAQRRAIHDRNLPIEAEVEALLNLDPDDPFIILRKGTLLYSQDDLAAAQPLLLRAALSLPTDFYSVSLLSEIASRNRAPNTALHYLEIAAHRASGVTEITPPVRAFAKGSTAILKDLGLPAPRDPRKRFTALYDALAQNRLDSDSQPTPECAAMLLAMSILDLGALPEAELDVALGLGQPLNLILVGLLREYALGVIGESFNDSIQVAAALLGATGGEFERRCLQEIAENASPEVAAAALWALDEMRLRSLHSKPPLGRPTLEDLCLVQDSDDDEDDYHGDDDDDEIDDAPPPPGRNDPCWCGSGKKYKKCHLDLDGQARRQPEAPADPLHSALLDRLGSHLASSTSQRERESVLLEIASHIPDTSDLAESAIHQLIHIWVPKRLGRTVAADYLIRHGHLLPAQQREILSAWVASAPSLYEILNVEPGKGVLLKDLIAGHELFLHDVSISNHAVKFDGLLIHIAPSDRGQQALSLGTTISHAHIQPFLDWLHHDRQSTGLAWNDYFRQHFLRIRATPAELARQRFDQLQLCNRDGDPILGSKATYSLLHPAPVRSALDAAPQLSPEDPGSYAWLSADPDNTILGTIQLSPSRLTLECNSRQRLDRGKALLAQLAGPHLSHLADDFTSQQQLKLAASSAPSNPEDDIPPEIQHAIVTQFMEKHMAEWPDTPLPALKGKTARQAVKTKAGRASVEALLRDFENSELHKKKQGAPWYDIDRVRKDLGLL